MAHVIKYLKYSLVQIWYAYMIMTLYQVPNDERALTRFAIIDPRNSIVLRTLGHLDCPTTSQRSLDLYHLALLHDLGMYHRSPSMMP